MHTRIKDIRAEKGMNQADFAKSLGIGQSTLGMLEVGKRDILDRHIKTICSIYDVNEHWLRTGEGEMFKQPKTFTLDEKAREHDLTDLEIEIMKNYMQLDKEVRKEILNMLKKSFNSTVSTEEDLAIKKEVKSYEKELTEEKNITTSSAIPEQDEEKETS